MEAALAAASASAATANYHRRPRTIADEWKTLQCVSAPKILTMVGQVRQHRAPADTSGFVLIKFQVVSVAPDERPPQVEAAARTLHAMGTSTLNQHPPLHHQQPLLRHHQHQELVSHLPEPPSYNRVPLPVITDHISPAPRQVRRSLKYDSIAPPSSPDGAGSSSGGSSPRDIHQCHFPGCSKTFDRRYNLKVHFRRHTNETPYPCKQPGCSQMFKWRSSLAHHMKTRHKTHAMSPIGKGMSPALSDVRGGSGLSARTVRYTAINSPPASSSGDSSKGGIGYHQTGHPTPSNQLQHAMSSRQPIIDVGHMHMTANGATDRMMLGRAPDHGHASVRGGR